MPKKEETIPANIKVEIAFGTFSFSTLSAAAKRYWWAKAIPKPRIKCAMQNKIKFCWVIAKTASKQVAELTKAPKMKPNFLPILSMIFAAIIVKIAVPRTDNAVGNVDKDFIEVICDPTIPLKKTVIILAVNPKTWLKANSDKFLFIKLMSWIFYLLA